MPGTAMGYDGFSVFGGRLEARMNVTVYCGSGMGDDPSFEQAARELGAWIARAGHGLVYGGSAVGLMGVVSAAAMAGGAHVVGVEPRFFVDREIPQHDLPEFIPVDTMSERKAIMIERGDAFVALPGGVGTLEEISEIMSRIRIGLTHAPCILVNIGGFYEPLRALLDNMVARGFLEREQRAAISFQPDAEGAISELAAFAAGRE